ncbi:ANTAR domain-containing response regulator [Pseudocolwellia sp. HL-MZ19]|uniref:ANTAR domain-containing response regulator n=1 Tax=unclassified Pseudocolwellia TaxID=2848178 RepID=UPI003CFB206F
MNSINNHSNQMVAKPKIKILLIENQNYKQNNIVEVLADSEYEVCCVLSTNSLFMDGALVSTESGVDEVTDSISLAREVEQHDPDVIVIDVEFPKERMLASLNYISSNALKPIVMFSEQDGTDLINVLIKSGVTAYVAGETDFRRIKSILDTAIARFVYHQTLKQELAITKNKLTHQRTVEQAKLLLMKNKRFTEQEAYHNIRKMAMNNGQKVEDVAKNIISLASIL